MTTVDTPPLAWDPIDERYKAGERYWLHEKELVEVAATVQAEFMDQDVWHDTVIDFVAGKDSVGVDEVLGHIGILLQDREQKHSNQVARILRAASWERKQRRVSDQRPTFAIRRRLKRSARKEPFRSPFSPDTSRHSLKRSPFLSVCRHPKLR